MISIVIPTLNAAHDLEGTFAALIPACLDGAVRQVVVVDGGSSDRTVEIADAAGATIVAAVQGRGTQLAAGARVARGQWLLFLHADTRLQAGWHHEAMAFATACDAGDRADSAAAFRFALDDQGAAPRLLEFGVGLRCTLMRMPYGDQGLLISRRLYDAIGGYRDLPLLEDVEIVRRLGRRRVHFLRHKALTSAVRYRRAGYARRVVRNLSCLAMYYAGMSPERIHRYYNS